MFERKYWSGKPLNKKLNNKKAGYKQICCEFICGFFCCFYKKALVRCRSPPLFNLKLKNKLNGGKKNGRTPKKKKI